MSGPSRLLRAYALTGGRTRSLHDDIEIESLVSTTAFGQSPSARLRLERAAIARLCREVLSVAEVSAHLDLPLGVARVLVGDMAFEGLVSIHRPVNPEAQPDRALLERVLAGLRSI
jgi:Protein of unknown function (DUF742)